MTITKFNKRNAQLTRAALHENLQEWLDENGLELDVGAMRYSDDSVECKIIVKTAGADEAEFNQNASWLQLEGQYGKEFRSGGKTYTITGVAPRSRKYPVLVRSHEDGKTYKFNREVVRAALGFPS